MRNRRGATPTVIFGLEKMAEIGLIDFWLNSIFLTFTMFPRTHIMRLNDIVSVAEV